MPGSGQDLIIQIQGTQTLPTESSQKRGKRCIFWKSYAWSLESWRDTWKVPELRWRHQEQLPKRGEDWAESWLKRMSALWGSELRLGQSSNLTAFLCHELQFLQLAYMLLFPILQHGIPRALIHQLFFLYSRFFLYAFKILMCNKRTQHFSLISSVQSLSRVRLFVTPWIAARQASLSITNSRSSLQLMSIESVMPSSYLILCKNHNFSIYS